MSRDYAWEKLYVAVLGMARSEAPLRDRLADAYASSIMRIEDADLPPDARNDFFEIQQALTRVEAKGDEGSISASAAALSDSEVHDLIGKVVDLYDRMALYGPSGASR